MSKDAGLISENADSAWGSYDLSIEQRPPSDSALTTSGSTEADALLLRENIVWFCFLRWLVVATMLGLALLAWVAGDRILPYGIRLEAAWPLGVAGGLAILNVMYLVMARTAARQQRCAALLMRNLWAQIVLDLVVLTVAVHYLGSLETYAPFMYLFHIVLACIFFPHARSLTVTLLAVGMYVGCVFLESAGIAGPSSSLASSLTPDRGRMSWLVLTSYVGSMAFISGTVWYLASRLAGALRDRDRALAAINRRLVAATEERARHMLRTTHQLKAPFAAIHANAQLLLDGYCGEIAAGPAAVIQQIAARCELLSREIKAMLQLTNLRSSAQAPPAAVSVDLPVVIRACLANLAPQAAKRAINVEEDLSSASVCAVEDHAIMIIENVLANAINYSHDGQRVLVRCRAETDGGAIVTVRDWGIGIAAEKLPRIFEDYFRTGEAAKHNGASTGLGLSILRQAAFMNKVGVRVESAPGKGTLFSLHFPASLGETLGGVMTSNREEYAWHTC
jgi:signal transduction histidine kinase